MIAGGHKLFDEVNKSPSSPTPIFMGFISFCRGVPVWAPKNEIMDDYSIISMKKTFLQCNNSMNGVKPMKVSIFWFRKDLRLFDNKAFSKCIAETDEILPIYIIEDDCSDPAILSQPRMQFLLACLEKLQDQLDQYKSKLY